MIGALCTVPAIIRLIICLFVFLESTRELIAGVSFENLLVGVLQLPRMTHVQAEVLEEAVVNAVDPAVNLEVLSSAPRILDYGGLANVECLLDHVELAEKVELFGIRGGLNCELVLVLNVNHVSQPIINKSQAIAIECCFDAATSIVTANNDMLYPQCLHRVLHDTQTVEVSVNNDVGDVAMHK